MNATLESRKERVKGHCFICFSRKHTLCDCPVDKPCYHCKRRKNHNRSLCPQKFSSDTESASLAQEDTCSEVNKSWSQLLIWRANELHLYCITFIVQLNNACLPVAQVCELTLSHISYYCRTFNSQINYPVDRNTRYMCFHYQGAGLQLLSYFNCPVAVTWVYMYKLCPW